VEEDACVGDGSAGGGVGSYGAEGGERLGGAADEEQRAHTAFGGDGAAGEDAEGGVVSERGNGDKADVGLSRSKAGGTLGGGGAFDLVAEGERGVEWRVFEVPHEWSWIEEVDGGDAQTRWRERAHFDSGYRAGGARVERSGNRGQGQKGAEASE
jgi:hypothetical protein